MNEKMPTFENKAEIIPNEHDVLRIIEKKIIESGIEGNYKVLRSIEDENGLYLLEVEGLKDESGDPVEYHYMRAGTYPEGSARDSGIDVLFYSGDIPVGGHSIAKHINGEWIDSEK